MNFENLKNVWIREGKYMTSLVESMELEIVVIKNDKYNNINILDWSRKECDNIESYNENVELILDKLSYVYKENHRQSIYTLIELLNCKDDLDKQMVMWIVSYIKNIDDHKIEYEFIDIINNSSDLIYKNFYVWSRWAKKVIPVNITSDILDLVEKKDATFMFLLGMVKLIAINAYYIKSNYVPRVYMVVNKDIDDTEIIKRVKSEYLSLDDFNYTIKRL